MNVDSLIVYNRQTLLDLRLYAEDLVKLGHEGLGNLPTFAAPQLHLLGVSVPAVEVNAVVGW